MISEGNLVQHLSSKQGYLELSRFKWPLSNVEVGDSITPLGNRCQCSVSLIVKKHFLRFRQNLLYFILCPLPLVLSLDKNVHLAPLYKMSMLNGTGPCINSCSSLLVTGLQLDFTDHCPQGSAILFILYVHPSISCLLRSSDE